MKKDNELIAKFMGGSLEERRIITYGGARTGKWTFPDGLWCYNDQLDYDTSWSRLMPVVEKILKTSDPAENGWPYEYLALEKTRIGNSIQYVYQRVVSFIKWYNSQPKH